MANRYPHFDFGRWDNYNNNVENVFETGNPGSTVLCTMQRSMDVSRTGAASGKLTFQGYKVNPSYYSPNLFFELVQYSSPPRGIFTVFNPGLQSEGGDGGKEFLFEAWVYTPSSNPIGSGDLSIQFGPGVHQFLGPNNSPGINPISIVSKQVSEFTDQWAKIEYRFIVEVGNVSFISIYADDATLRVGDLPVALNPNFVGSLNVGGVLYVDDIVLTDLSALVCDLAPAVPAYTKTNETAVDANDGTIELHATSSYSRLYSLDNVNFFVSPLFTGLAPGTYTGYVKDTNPSGCSITIPGIVITEFDPPDPPDPPAPGPLQVSAEPVNLNNFISWFATTGPTNFTEIVFSDCCWDFANPYRAKNPKKRKHYPIVCNGEQFTFYMNFEAPYSDPNFADFRLYLINNVEVVQTDIAPLQRHFLPDDAVNYNIYAGVTLSGVETGIYRLAVVNNVNSEILFISQEIRVMLLDEAKCYSTRFMFRASFNAYKFYYLLVPTFLQTIRLMYFKIDQQSEGDIDQYRAVSSGELRNYNAELDRLLVFETYWFDDLANWAMEVLAIHDTILLNGKKMVPKGLFKADYKVDDWVNKGKLEMYLQAFSTQNRYGDPGDVILPGPPVLLGDGGGKILL